MSQTRAITLAELRPMGLAPQNDRIVIFGVNGVCLLGLSCEDQGEATCFHLSRPSVEITGLLAWGLGAKIDDRFEIIASDIPVPKGIEQPMESLYSGDPERQMVIYNAVVGSLAGGKVETQRGSLEEFDATRAAIATVLGAGFVMTVPAKEFDESMIPRLTDRTEPKAMAPFARALLAYYRPMKRNWETTFHRLTPKSSQVITTAPVDASGHDQLDAVEKVTNFLALARDAGAISGQSYGLLRKRAGLPD